MDKLWRFTSSVDSFELKDIEAALSEIQVTLGREKECFIEHQEILEEKETQEYCKGECMAKGYLGIGIGGVVD